MRTYLTRLTRLGALCAVVLASLALGGGLGRAAAASAVSTGDSTYLVPSCGVSIDTLGRTPGFADCNAILNLKKVGSLGTAGPNGYHPADLQSAYNLATAAKADGGGQTVGIVDAYNDPNAESDLGVYRSEFGLAPCTTANLCFKKVNQTGGTTYPKNNGGWAQEISLDVDMVSAICPNCHILLVEAASNGYDDLGTAVTEAATLGANAISNSYGGTDSSGDFSHDPDYNQPGHAVTASTGDCGNCIEFPASSRHVTAVGGTTLKKNTSTRTWGETAWSSGGSGCSVWETQPSWQVALTALYNVCSNRATADVSADADPNTGVSVYDSYSYRGRSGWLVFGGTSVSTPIVASVYALAGNASTVTEGSYSYSHTSSLYDVTSGSNGSCGTILCNAATGWDGPTGNGTPNGTGAF